MARLCVPQMHRRLPLLVFACHVSPREVEPRGKHQNRPLLLDHPLRAKYCVIEFDWDRFIRDFGEAGKGH